MAAAATAPRRPPRKQAGPALLALPLVVGGAVSVSLGVYARFHSPTLKALFGLKPGDQTIAMKSWLTVIIFVLSLFQLVTSLRIYRKISWPAKVPKWWVPSHRIAGIAAYVISLPVAFHCLWTLGFRPNHPFDRALIHSIFGCLFYGAYAAKIIVIHKRGFPRWFIPWVGAVIFTCIVFLFYTGSVWYFTGLPTVP